ncbi:MAG: D-alanine--D-alanine ligase [Verrucomicrobiota bacterium]
MNNELIAQKRVTVLKGGTSSEREVSLLTGAAVSEGLRQVGYEVLEIDVQDESIDWLEGNEPIFICLHGTFGEDGELQDQLQSAGRIFTGSNADACRLAFDKVAAKTKFIESGLHVANGGKWEEGTQVPIPFVLKPIADGSSVGVYLVRTEDERQAAEQAAVRHGRYMHEAMIHGRELTVGVLEGQALPLIEIQPHDGFYDYENKYTSGKTEHLCPAPLEDTKATEIQQMAITAHKSLGCDVYSRVDFILSEDGTPYVLEVNTIPGMTELSLLPEAAAEAGISFPELCKRILETSIRLRT